MQVARDLEPLAQQRRRRTRCAGRSPDRDGSRPWCPCRAPAPTFLSGPCGPALMEALLPLRAVAPDGGDELLRQRVDHAGADAVQAARGLVVAGLELAAGVEDREDDLERALAGLGMLVDRNAAPIVGDGERRAVGVQRDGDRRGVAVHRLVDGVVENLPGEVVQAGGADAADVHARALADGLEAFENGDVFRGVGRRHRRQRIAQDAQPRRARAMNGAGKLSFDAPRGRPARARGLASIDHASARRRVLRGPQASRRQRPRARSRSAPLRFSSRPGAPAPT